MSEAINIYHTVYQITNLINGRFYIGKQSTNKPYDSYMGSSNIIKQAIKNYGKENFRKDILFYCDSEDEAYEIESLIVTEELINLPECYNLKPGGKGGSKKIRPDVQGENNPIPKGSKRPDVQGENNPVPKGSKRPEMQGENNPMKKEELKKQFYGDKNPSADKNHYNFYDTKNNEYYYNYTRTELMESFPEVLHPGNLTSLIQGKLNSYKGLKII